MQAVTIPVNRWQRILGLVLAFLVPCMILTWPKYDSPTANRCFALLISVIILWVSNALPLFVTALLVPFFGVVGRMMLDESGEMLYASSAMQQLLSVMLGTVIPVLLASFCIAHCLLRRPPRLPFQLPPTTLLLVLMSISLTMCIGLANTSCAIFAQMLLDGMDGIIEGQYAKALLMGVAVACNLGGYLSPVSSGQSVFIYTLAPEEMEMTWWVWMRVTIPCAYLGILVGWLYICWYYDLGSIVLPKRKLIPLLENSSKEESMPKWKLYTAIAITIATVILWATSSLTEAYLGGMGCIAFIPIVLLFALDILALPDLHKIPWDFVLFMMGSLALVEVVRSSGLLQELTVELSGLLEGHSSLVKLFIISSCLFIASTIKSHTIAGMVFVPIVANYAAEDRATFMAAVTATFSGMAFRFSSLTNMALMTATDGDGNTILTQRDFLTVAGPISLISFIISITVVPLLL